MVYGDLLKLKKQKNSTKKMRRYPRKFNRDLLVTDMRIISQATYGKRVTRQSRGYLYPCPSRATSCDAIITALKACHEIPV